MSGIRGTASIGARLAATLLVLWPSTAGAQGVPEQTKFGIGLMPLSPVMAAAEYEFRPLPAPLTLGVRGTFPLSPAPYPSAVALTARLGEVVPESHPSLSPLVGVGALVSTTTPMGSTVAAVGMFGVTYQQAYGSLWWRISPNICYPFSFMEYLMLNQSWADIGWRMTDNFEVSIGASITPLRLSLVF